jgi:hypothetical protein
MILQTAYGGETAVRSLFEPQTRHERGAGGMSQRTFWRWLLLNKGLPWIGIPLWQYVLLDWAAWLLAGLVVSAIVGAVAGHFPLAWFLGWAVAGILVRPVLARRRWRRIQVQVSPASVSIKD